MISFTSCYCKSTVKHCTSSFYIMGMQKREKNHWAFPFHGKPYEATKLADALRVSTKFPITHLRPRLLVLSSQNKQVLFSLPQENVGKFNRLRLR